MVPLRRLTSLLLILSLFASVIHGPLRVVAKANVTTDEELGLQFRLSHGVAQPEKRNATKL